MALSISYIEAIGEGWPAVQCSAPGCGTIYENIVWEAGDALPSKAALDAWIVEHLKQHMWELIKAERARRTNESGTNVGTDWFHSDLKSKQQQQALFSSGENIPANLYWKTLTGSFVLITQALASQIFYASMSSEIAIFTVAEQKKAAMFASSTPETYDYLSGWPLGYGE